LDEIAGGGLPRGRTTLMTGGPGCGKTLLAMQFLVKGAVDYGEPGVFFAFEESPEELTQNVASLGWDLTALQADGVFAVDYVRPEFSEMHETGDWDLDGLLIRLRSAIERVGARRLVLDTIEALFGVFSNEKVLRRELRRLFRWLNDRGVTALVTAERGSGEFTRHGLEEYVSDCVIALDHRVSEQISTRRVRIVKYRGSAHGSDEYPFTIDGDGFSVMPLTSIGLEHRVFDERVSSGIGALDEMLSGAGYFRGSTVLVSGSPGSGKSSLGAAFLQAGCARGERALLFAFEESPEQVVRNMQSIGVDLEPARAEGLLRIISARPSAFGLETHLGAMHRAVGTFGPQMVAIDPVSGLSGLAFEITDPHPRHRHAEDGRDHGPTDRDDVRGPPRGRRRYLLTDRHLDHALLRGVRRQARAADQRRQVARHGSLQRVPALPPDR
jgi:circadian clock protein KaiC